MHNIFERTFVVCVRA